MNLGELYIKISADTSAISDVGDKFSELMKVAEQVSSSIGNVEKAINSLEASMVSEVATGFSHVSTSGEGAADSTRTLAQELENAVMKGELLADVIGGAFNTIIDMAKSAAGAVADFIGGAVEEYASYEQNLESMNRTFGDYAGDFRQWMQDNASTFGMSMNEMMEHANKTGVILQKDNAQRREAEAAGEQASTEMQKQELSNRLQDLRASLSNQLAETREAQQAEYNSWKNYYANLEEQLRDQLQDEYDQLKDYLDSRVDAQRKANEQEYNERKRVLEDSYDALKDSLDKEVDAFESATDQRIKQIDREYTERYKLIDEQKYAELKALQDQIDALDAQQKAEDRAAQDRKDAKRKADLEYKAANEKFREDRDKAARELAELEVSIEERKNKDVRSDMKSSLKQQMSDVKDHYSKMKSQLNEQHDGEVSSYKDARAMEEAALRESNENKLKLAKRANEDELRELKNYQKQVIDSMTQENENLLKEKRRSNKQLLAEQKAADDEQLANLKASQSAQLREIQEHNRKVLQEQSNLISQQKKQLSSASKQASGYADVTSEDQLESMKTLQSLFQTAADVAAARNMTTDEVLKIFESMNYGRFATFDNLGLGYANKTGIQQMVADMSSVVGRQLDPDNFNDVAQALSALVEKYHMSGQAARESIHTISGSMNRLKANLADLKLALATEGVEDDETILHQLFYGSGEVEGDQGAVVNFINNVMPVVKTIIDRLVEFIKERGPEITQRLKEAIPEDLVPQKVWDVLDAILKIAEKLGDALIWVANNMDTVVTGIEAVGTALGFVTLLNTVMKVKEVVEFLAGAKGIKSVTDALSGLSGASSAGAGALGGLGQAASGAAGSGGLGGVGEAAASAAGAGGLGGLKAALGEAAAGFAGIPAVALLATVAIGNMLYAHEKETHAVENFSKAHEGFANRTQFEAEETARVVQEQSQKVISGQANMGQSAEELKQKFESMSTETQTSITNMSESAKQQAEATGNWTENIKNFFGGLMETTTTSSGEMKNVLLTDLDSMNTGVTVGTASMGSAWSQSMADMKQGTIDASSGVKVETASMLTDIKANFSGSGELLKTSGNSMVAGFGEGAEHGGAWENVKNFFKGILDWIVQNKGPVDRDRQALVPAGNAIMQGLKDGSESGWPGVQGFFLGIPSAISSVFGGSGSWLQGDGVNVMNGLQSGLGNAWPAVSSFISSIPNGIMSAFSNAGDWLVNAGSNIMTGFYNGLVGIYNNLVQPLISGVGSWIQQNKGPEQYDKRLLIRNGQWVMQSLYKGLESGFDTDVAPFVRGISGMIEEMAGTSDLSYGAMFDGMEDMSDAFSDMVGEMVDVWRDSTEEMAEIMSDAIPFDMGTFSSPFARGMMSAATSQRQVQQPTTISAILELDRVQFGRLVYQLNDEERQRVGVNLSGGRA